MHGSHFGPSAPLELLPPTTQVTRWGRDRLPGQRVLAEECATALVYDGTTVAVVMATPADLADLAVGFSLTEGIVGKPADVATLDVVAGEDGIELRMWLAPDTARDFRARQRRLVGPTGCGLCGIESLREAARPTPRLAPGIALSPAEIADAVEALARAQRLNRDARAVHAAGFYLPGRGLALSREDVGRHNALDKLAGALSLRGIPGASGAVVLTSRISVEMVQKSAALGATVLVAISAPTALAVRTADACGMTLIGIARGADFEVFSHPDAVHDT